MYRTWKNTKCRKSKTIISELKNRLFVMSKNQQIFARFSDFFFFKVNFLLFVQKNELAFRQTGVQKYALA